MRRHSRPNSRTTPVSPPRHGNPETSALLFGRDGPEPIRFVPAEEEGETVRSERRWPGGSGRDDSHGSRGAVDGDGGIVANQLGGAADGQYRGDPHFPGDDRGVGQNAPGFRDDALRDA